MWPGRSTPRPEREPGHPPVPGPAVGRFLIASVGCVILWGMDPDRPAHPRPPGRRKCLLWAAVVAFLVFRGGGECLEACVVRPKNGELRGEVMKLWKGVRQIPEGRRQFGHDSEKYW